MCPRVSCGLRPLRVFAHDLEVILCHEVNECAPHFGVQFAKALEAVEFFKGGDDRLPLCLGVGAFNGFPKQFFWNVNCRFYASKML
jgi:hypothetical protein